MRGADVVAMMLPLHKLWKNLRVILAKAEFLSFQLVKKVWISFFKRMATFMQ